MKLFVCLEVDDDAVPFGIGQECPNHRMIALDITTAGIISMIDRGAWVFDCTKGCRHHRMPAKVAWVHVDVVHERAPSGDR